MLILKLIACAVLLAAAWSAMRVLQDATAQARALRASDNDDLGAA